MKSAKLSAFRGQSWVPDCKPLLLSLYGVLGRRPDTQPHYLLDKGTGQEQGILERERLRNTTEIAP